MFHTSNQSHDPFPNNPHCCRQPPNKWVKTSETLCEHDKYLRSPGFLLRPILLRKDWDHSVQMTPKLWVRPPKYNIGEPSQQTGSAPIQQGSIHTGINSHDPQTMGQTPQIQHWRALPTNPPLRGIKSKSLVKGHQVQIPG